MDKRNKAAKHPEDVILHSPDGKVFDVPVEGSLSLLALGYKGLMAWRAKRIAAAKDMEGHFSK